jgi:hypothetical protein
LTKPISNAVSAIKGSLVANALGQQETGTGFGAQAQVHKRHGEGRIVSGVDQIAMQEQRGANAHSGAANGTHQGFGEGGNRTQEAKHRRVFAGGWVVQKIGNVVARAKHAGMALNDHATHGCVGCGSLKRVRTGGVHGLGEGIFFVCPVERQRHHVVVGVNQYVLHGETFEIRILKREKPEPGRATNAA